MTSTASPRRPALRRSMRRMAEFYRATEEFSTEDLLLQEQQQGVEESAGQENNPAPMMLTLKVLSTTMDQVNTPMDLLAEKVSNFNRSSSVRALVEKDMCYRELFLQKKEAHQTTITSFFKTLS
ncbi:hypothetical protein Hamer_G012506 [Homarus americanus]|uniref:Uncharacterized protein n=1 Tax=Homarus americanus TaxID=6706 RepID=A0A8J5KP78_HOMAM|nr:hypothetical protein Hamer_G012506 [Homarus americanus]